MNKCTEDWPSKPSAVSPDAYEAFLAHAAGCLFHAKVLEEEAEKIRSKYRLARGLDSHGRILVGRELQRAVEKHDRQYILWKEVAQKSSILFKRIFLSNCGEEIAVSAKFFDFRRYEATHQLDTRAGLQIFGVIGEGKSIMEVLLGFYPLEGFKHTGEEQFLPLENEYTVGLGVEQLSEHDFYIEFRCVKNQVIERERISSMHHFVNNTPPPPWRAATHTAQWLGSSFRWTTAKLKKLCSSVIQSEPLTFRQKIACYTAWAVVFGATLMILPSLNESPQGMTGVANEVETKQRSRPANAKGKRSRGRVGRPAQQKSDQTTVRSDDDPKPAHAGLTPPTGQGGGNESITAPNDKQPAPESKPDTNTEPVDTAPVPWHFQSQQPAGVPTEGIAVHSGSDPALAKKLTVEMRKRDINIRPFNVRKHNAPHVAVTWSILREETAVTVKAQLTTESDSKVLTFRSDGNCPEQVCDEAVRTAVTGVIAVMRDLKQNEPTHSEEF